MVACQQQEGVLIVHSKKGTLVLQRSGRAACIIRKDAAKSIYICIEDGSWLGVQNSMQKFIW